MIVKDYDKTLEAPIKDEHKNSPVLKIRRCTRHVSKHLIFSKMM